MSNESKLRVRRRFTLEFKREAVDLIQQQGLSIAEAARRLDVRETLLRRWRKELGVTKASIAGQPTALEAEVRQLREEVRRLTMERETLKKRPYSSRRSRSAIRLHRRSLRSSTGGCAV